MYSTCVRVDIVFDIWVLETIGQAKNRRCQGKLEIATRRLARGETNVRTVGICLHRKSRDTTRETWRSEGELHSTSSRYCDDQCSPDLFSLAPVAMFSALVQCHYKPGRQLGKLKYIRIFVSSFLSECHIYYCSCQGTFTHAHDIRYETEIWPFCMSTYIFIRAKSFSSQLNLSCNRP